MFIITRIAKKFLTQRKGFNLIEVLLALTIFGIAVPSIGALFSFAYKEESDNTRRTQALFLAESLMSEISQRRFRESAVAPGNGPDAGEISGSDRRNFDDIDDYSIFSKDSSYSVQWGALSPPQDESGTALTDFSMFKQYVEVSNVSSPSAGPTARTDYNSQTEGTTDFKMVKITISWDNGLRKVNLFKVFARQ